MKNRFYGNIYEYEVDEPRQYIMSQFYMVESNRVTKKTNSRRKLLTQEKCLYILSLLSLSTIYFISPSGSKSTSDAVSRLFIKQLSIDNITEISIERKKESCQLYLLRERVMNPLRIYLKNTKIYRKFKALEFKHFCDCNLQL